MPTITRTAGDWPLSVVPIMINFCFDTYAPLREEHIPTSQQPQIAHPNPVLRSDPLDCVNSSCNICLYPDFKRGKRDSLMTSKALTRAMALKQKRSCTSMRGTREFAFSQP